MSDKPALPDDLAQLAERCLVTARKHLANDGYLLQMAFVGAGVAMPDVVVVLPIGSLPSKDMAAAAVSATAQRLEARFIMMLGESWALDETSAADYKAILQRYGSLSKAPMAKEIVHCTIETTTGMWMAMADQFTGDDGRKSFGAMNFKMTGRSEGRFVGLMPKGIANG